MIDTAFWHGQAPPIAMSPDSVAEAIGFALDQPAGVDLNTVTIRPIGQPVRLRADSNGAPQHTRLDLISYIETYRRRVRTLYLAVDEYGSREIVALHRSYNIDLKELRVLEADRVGPCFSRPDRWRHEEVFG
ncbi:hypothetical protein [Nocardia sp. NPDC019304]|uniref:hypothetical protein n=1 Tax=unclassified Nocardia TaxID=2637762 RepID=UPI0033E21AD5